MGVGVGEIFRAEPVVARLMVLEPEMAGAVRKREQEIIVFVMPRAEEGLRLGFALANAVLLTLPTADYNPPDLERIYPLIELHPYQDAF